MSNLDRSEDIFKDTRMSFGDHLEELRMRMWLAIKALLLCLIAGFMLDGIGSTMQWKYFGLGKPVLELIKAPAEEQMNAFYDERAWKATEQLAENQGRDDDKKKYLEKCRQMRRGDIKALNEPQKIRLEMNLEDLRQALERRDAGYAPIEAKVAPIDLAIMLRLAQERVGKRNQLAALGAPEMFVAYFKVTLCCGFVLASPFIFYQFWAFVGAGLYPHEKRYMHVYLPFSLGLFFAGVLMCFAWVLPGGVKALFGFNDWFDVDPDLRMNEWLSFAVVLPLVFGISFQTPLVLLFFNRLGIFGYADYLSKWRYAMMFLAVFAAVITPTTDAVTMLYLFVPTFGLYLFGILLCYLAPPRGAAETKTPEREELAV